MFQFFNTISQVVHFSLWIFGQSLEGLAVFIEISPKLSNLGSQMFKEGNFFKQGGQFPRASPGKTEGSKASEEEISQWVTPLLANA